jgi:hypothetical protein
MLNGRTNSIGDYGRSLAGDIACLRRLHNNRPNIAHGFANLREQELQAQVRVNVIWSSNHAGSIITVAVWQNRQHRPLAPLNQVERVTAIVSATAFVRALHEGGRRQAQLFSLRRQVFLEDLDLRGDATEQAFQRVPGRCCSSGLPLPCPIKRG